MLTTKYIAITIEIRALIITTINSTEYLKYWTTRGYDSP